MFQIYYNEVDRMLRVVFCDDNKISMDYYQSLITQASEHNDIDIKVNQFGSPDKLLSYMSKDPNRADIIYLDILFEGMNGIDAARKLREMGCLSVIIFLTVSSGHVFEAFEINPFYYIVKDEVPANKFKDIFFRAAEAASQKKDRFIIISHAGTYLRLSLDEILYFEVFNRQITIHLTENEITYSSRLDDIEKSLDKMGFIRTHRSFLVNCEYVKCITRKKLILTDGTELPVSTKYAKDVLKSFSEFLLQI